MRVRKKPKQKKEAKRKKISTTTKDSKKLKLPKKFSSKKSRLEWIEKLEKTMRRV